MAVLAISVDDVGSWAWPSRYFLAPMAAPNTAAIAPTEISAVAALDSPPLAPALVLPVLILP